MQVVACTIFYDDLEGLKRLRESTKDFFHIFVDGRFVHYESPHPLSTDGSREWLIKQPKTALIDKPDLIEYQKRNSYIELAQSLGFDYCLVIDSDEYIEKIDLETFLDSLQSKEPAYTIQQNYDQTFHLPFYRLHTSKARHQGKHQECFLDDMQIFTQTNPLAEGIMLRHDKCFRKKEREEYRLQYYEANPIR